MQVLEEIKVGSLFSEVSRAVAMEINIELKCVSGMKGNTKETRFSIRLQKNSTNDKHMTILVIESFQNDVHLKNDTMTTGSTADP